jgi:PAS domain S-box-containing protein
MRDAAMNARKDNLKFESLRTLAEEIVGSKTDEKSVVAHNEVKTLIHELQVYQAELEVQNDELRCLQTQLETSRNRYYELFDCAPVGYIIIDAHFIITEINSTALEQLGKYRLEMINRPLLHFVSSKDHGRMVSFLRTIAQSDERHEILVELIRADGAIINARLDAVRSEGQTETNDHHLLTVTDLTELRKAQDALEKSESIYRTLVDSSVDHIFLLDTNGIYLASNDNVGHLGYTSGQELIGRHFSEIYPEDIAALYRIQFDEVVTSRKPVAFEHDLRTDEQRIFHHDRLYPIFKGKSLWSIGGICRDTTEQKKAQKKNDQLIADLQQKQKIESLGTLAGGIAHDFNNILTAVLGYTELSLEGVEKGTHMEEDLKKVLQAGIRAKNLVSQILAYSRKSNEERHPVRIDEMAEEVLQLIRPSLPSSIDIIFTAESKAKILGNATQVHQILMNLCSNAAHAMQEKGGVLTIGIKDIHLDKGGLLLKNDLKEGEYVEIVVSDTGHGISPEIIDKVFDPYFTTKGLGTGTGMGLAVVVGIVESYGGTIHLESLPDQGTTLHVYIPIIQDGRDSALQQPAEPLGQGKGRILFIDDEETIVAMNKRILERLGYQVTGFAGSIDALEYFRMQPYSFDVIITDMTMPRLNGEDLAREAMRIRADIPIILCSGYTCDMTSQRSKELGIRAFFMKPVDKRELAQCLGEILHPVEFDA